MKLHLSAVSSVFDYMKYNDPFKIISLNIAEKSYVKQYLSDGIKIDTTTRSTYSFNIKEYFQRLQVWQYKRILK